jgi:hypothetical protein
MRALETDYLVVGAGAMGNGVSRTASSTTPTSTSRSSIVAMRQADTGRTHIPSTPTSFPRPVTAVRAPGPGTGDLRPAASFLRVPHRDVAPALTPPQPASTARARRSAVARSSARTRSTRPPLRTTFPLPDGPVKRPPLLRWRAEPRRRSHRGTHRARFQRLPRTHRRQRAAPSPHPMRTGCGSAGVTCAGASG